MVNTKVNQSSNRHIAADAGETFQIQSFVTHNNSPFTANIYLVARSLAERDIVYLSD